MKFSKFDVNCFSKNDGNNSSVRLRTDSVMNSLDFRAKVEMLKETPRPLQEGKRITIEKTFIPQEEAVNVNHYEALGNIQLLSPITKPIKSLLFRRHRPFRLTIFFFIVTHACFSQSTCSYCVYLARRFVKSLILNLPQS